MALDIRIDRIRGEEEREGGGASGESGYESTRTPRSTEEARRAVEQARGRISSTIDAIEGRVQEAREGLKERLDVLRPVRDQVRRHGVRALGIAFGTGLALGFLTGGEDRDLLDEDERRELRRWRAERRGRLRQREAHEWERQRHRPRRGRSALSQLQGVLISAAIAGLTERGRRMLESRRQRKAELEHRGLEERGFPEHTGPERGFQA